jgi:arylsulfatase A-like enzyme
LSKRAILGLSAVCACFAAGLLGGCKDEEDPLPPVILISLDTLRADHTGFMGYERETTPFLDELAQESMVFERAYTTMSWTLIAHMSLMTGLYPSQHKVWKTESILPESVPTLTQKLKARGYHTMGFHFPGWLDPNYGFGRDFDLYLPHNNLKQAGVNIREAMANRPKDKPYFLFIHLFDIHNKPVLPMPSPLYQSPAPYDEMFMEGSNDLLDGTVSYELWNMATHGLNIEQKDAVVAQYDGGIRYVDDELRTWAEEWRSSGTFDDAVVIITSDHGEGLAQRRKKYSGHGDTYEEGLHVPLLIKFPGGLHANTRVKEMVSHVDIMPTVLDYLGHPIDERFPGYSLLTGRPAEALLVAEGENTEVFYRWPYKLVRKRDLGTDNGLLTNLMNDPKELKPMKSWRDGDVFMEMAGSIREYAQTTTAAWHWPEEGEKPEKGPLNEDQLRALEALGYTGDE